MVLISTRIFTASQCRDFDFEQESLDIHDVVILISPRNFSLSRRCDSGPNCRCMRFMQILTELE